MSQKKHYINMVYLLGIVGFAFDTSDNTLDVISGGAGIATKDAKKVSSNVTHLHKYCNNEV